MPYSLAFWYIFEPFNTFKKPSCNWSGCILYTSLNDCSNRSRFSYGSPAIKSRCWCTFPALCTDATTFFNFSSFIVRSIASIVCGLVDCTPISSCTSPSRMAAISASSASLSKSAATSKWKFVTPLSCVRRKWSNASVLSWLQLNVLSTNLTCGTLASRKICNSAKTSGRLLKRTERDTDDRQ